MYGTEELAQIASQLDGDETPPQPDTTSTETPKEEVKVEANAEEQVPDEGHPIPYSRFKQVLEARNTSRKEVEELKARLEKLESSTREKPKDEPKSLDDLLASIMGTKEDDPEEELPNRLAQIEQQLESFKIDQELAIAQAKYPSVPQAYILKQIATDPRLTALQIAEQYTVGMAALEERAIAKFAKEHNIDVNALRAKVQQTSSPAIPPRPTTTGPSPVIPAKPGAMNWEEMTDQVAAFLNGSK